MHTFTILPSWLVFLSRSRPGSVCNSLLPVSFVETTKPSCLLEFVTYFFILFSIFFLWFWLSDNNKDTNCIIIAAALRLKRGGFFRGSADIAYIHAQHTCALRTVYTQSLNIFISCFCVRLLCQTWHFLSKDKSVCWAGLLAWCKNTHVILIPCFWLSHDGHIFLNQVNLVFLQFFYREGLYKK